MLERLICMRSVTARHPEFHRRGIWQEGQRHWPQGEMGDTSKAKSIWWVSLSYCSSVQFGDNGGGVRGLEAFANRVGGSSVHFGGLHFAVRAPAGRDGSELRSWFSLIYCCCCCFFLIFFVDSLCAMYDCKKKLCFEHTCALIKYTYNI